uniref:Histone PARylation factor 1 n=1 Tax=Eptatretus burgeri TaxID=7764 RepID=A0A8C4QEB4_EPTBU
MIFHGAHWGVSSCKVSSTVVFHFTLWPLRVVNHLDDFMGIHECPASEMLNGEKVNTTEEVNASHFERETAGRVPITTHQKRVRAEDNRDDETLPTNLPAVSVAQRSAAALCALPLPEDFFNFWALCTSMNPQSPHEALLPVLGLELVGPFDLLRGRHKGFAVVTTCAEEEPIENAPNLDLHWRFYYDPPEFQTVAKGDAESQLHLGYYRDTPNELPVLVGLSSAQSGCSISVLGDNLFCAIRLLLLRQKREGRIKDRTKAEELERKLSQIGTELGYSTDQKSKSLKARDRKVVSRTFHGAGIVVPVDAQGVGYRELPESNASLQRMLAAIVKSEDDAARLQAFSPLVELSSLVEFANDEGDPGMGLELGLDLFLHGSEYLHKMSARFLNMAYSLLGRVRFGRIITAHLVTRLSSPTDQFADRRSK